MVWITSILFLEPQSGVSRDWLWVLNHDFIWAMKSYLALVKDHCMDFSPLKFCKHERILKRHSWQIRSHAQKYFLKVQKNGTVAHVPPPRPKRKASHPYPQKAPKNGWFLYDKKKNISEPEVCISEILNLLFSFLFLVVLVPLKASAAYQSSSVNSIASGYPTWEEASVLVNNASTGTMSSENEYSFLGVEGLSNIYACYLCVHDCQKKKKKSEWESIHTYLPENECRDFLIKGTFLLLLWHANITDSADIGSKGAATISNCSMNAFGSSPRAPTSSELPKQGKQDSVVHGKLKDLASNSFQRPGFIHALWILSFILSSSRFVLLSWVLSQAALSSVIFYSCFVTESDLLLVS